MFLDHPHQKLVLPPQEGSKEACVGRWDPEYSAWLFRMEKKCQHHEIRDACDECYAHSLLIAKHKA